MATRKMVRVTPPAERPQQARGATKPGPADCGGLASPDVEVRCKTIVALGESFRDKRGSSENLAALVQHFDGGIERNDERRAALWALAQAKQDDHTARFRAQLAKGSQIEVIDAALFIGCVREPDTVGALALGLLRFPTLAVGRAVTWAASAIGGTQGEGLLQTLLEARCFVSEALEAVVEFPAPRLLDAVVPFVDELLPDVRIRAIRAVQGIAEQHGRRKTVASGLRSLDAYLQRAKDDDAEEVSVAAEVCLQALERARSGSDSSVRRQSTKSRGSRRSALRRTEN